MGGRDRTVKERVRRHRERKRLGIAAPRPEPVTHILQTKPAQRDDWDPGPPLLCYCRCDVTGERPFLSRVKVTRSYGCIIIRSEQRCPGCGCTFRVKRTAIPKA